ncbi:MAG: acylneuraminate cytidylyltransferase family protein [Limnohabitans sp.]|nr:acylneuraminate cytidylyltransferase family protein [Limnohabitans sp.]
MKTIVIIPARGGSKRLPNKNILDLGGIPLLAHSINYAKNNLEIIDDIYVSTDDFEIQKKALEFGAKVILRPKEISGDLEPTVTALKHILENCEEQIENVVLLQPTNPLRPEGLLKEAFQKFLDLKCDSLFTVSRNHQKFGTIQDEKFHPYNYTFGQRSQDLEPLFFENGLLYITKSKLIFEDKIISQDAYPMVVNHIFTNIDIDTQDDFEYAQYIIQKKYGDEI